MTEPLKLFYGEPDFDRWFPLDHFPRRLIRRIARGPHRPGGQMRVFLNLCAGLDRLGIPYRTNEFRSARRNPEQLCCVLGKRHVLDRELWPNPLMIGPAIHDHPIDDPDLFRRRNIRRILVPGEYMRRMCAPYWGDRVFAWPVGIDTDEWTPAPNELRRDIDFVVYDKIRWNRETVVPQLLDPILAQLEKHKLRTVIVRYGAYAPDDYGALLRRSRGMVFVCEHETQGIAYQEALACGIPLLAWSGTNVWSDPAYFPDRIKYAPVSAVPYWDDRCGVQFRGAADFLVALDEFEHRRETGLFDPRGYVLDNLTLERCATNFVAHALAAAAQPNALPIPDSAGRHHSTERDDR